MIRGELAQVLTDYGVIRVRVGVETYSENRTSLEVGSVAGQVPPALLDTPLSNAQFNEKGGMTLQLVRAPAGTFVSYPAQDQYALIAKVATAAGRHRLQLLRRELPQADGDKLWLSENELYFPLDVGTGEAPLGLAPTTDTTSASSSASDTSSTTTSTTSPTTPVTSSTNGSLPQTSWSDPTASITDNTWAASARICVAGSDQQPLSGINAQVQYQVTEQVQTWDGQTTSRSWTTQVALTDGCADVSQADLPIPVSGQEGVTALQFQVLSVIYYWPTDPEIKWDGVAPTITVKVPQS